MRLDFTDNSIREPGRLSFSSLNSYIECGERWRLERGYGMNTSTWFATVGGSAAHEITEMMDLRSFGRDVEVPTFKETFDRYLAIEAEKNIEVKPSGKKLVNLGLQGGPNKKDYDWWLHFGPIMVQGWATWRAETPWSLLTLPNGEPAIEVPITQNIAGEAKLGYVDRIFRRDEDGALILLDLKFGNDPSSALQLGDYRLGLKREHGLEIDLGCFWSGSKGDTNAMVDLTVYSGDFIESLYEQAWRGIRAGIFLPNTSSMCRGCGVRDFCRATGGKDALLFPVRTDVKPQPEISPEGVAHSPAGV